MIKWAMAKDIPISSDELEIILKTPLEDLLGEIAKRVEQGAKFMATDLCSIIKPNELTIEQRSLIVKAAYPALIDKESMNRSLEQNLRDLEEVDA